MTPEQLKASILQLAIQGKLVPQRPDEGTAEELYQQIQREKKKLTAAGKLKKEKPLPPISEEEIPFDIPESWKWVRLGELGSYKKGPFGSALTKNMFVPKGNETIKVYEQKNAIQKDQKLGNYYITKAYFDDKLKGFEVLSGDIIVSCAGTIGETYVLPENIEKGIINQALMRIRLLESVDVPFFLLFFDFVLKKSAQKSSKGSAIKNIPPFEILKSYLVPLPPLAEQRRIVEKIDQMLPLVEQYGEAYTALESLDARFPDDMRKSILKYAIQGKLVPQRPEEGTAEDLYQQIQKEKKKLIAAGKLKKEKPLPPISEEEIPFDIPESWKWVRGRDLVNIISGTSYAKNDERHEGIRIIRGGNVKQGRVNLLDDDVYIDERLSDPEKTLLRGDIVIIGSTGSSKVIGNAGFVEKTDATAQIGAFLRILRAFCPETCDYLNLIFQSSYYKGHIVHEAKGTNINNIKASYINDLMIPLPPLIEQKRIVQQYKMYVLRLLK